LTQIGSFYFLFFLMSDKRKPPRDDSQVQEIDLSSIDLSSLSLPPESDTEGNKNEKNEKNHLILHRMKLMMIFHYDQVIKYLKMTSRMILKMTSRMMTSTKVMRMMMILKTNEKKKIHIKNRKIFSLINDEKSCEEIS